MDYWRECIEEAFEDAGIEATEAQKDTVASWVDGANENYGLASGSEFIPYPMSSEVESLKVQLGKQQESHDNRIYLIRKEIAFRQEY